MARHTQLFIMRIKIGDAYTLVINDFIDKTLSSSKFSLYDGYSAYFKITSTVIVL